jgi:hypothetical protein
MYLDYNFIFYLLATTSHAHCKHHDRGSLLIAKKAKACYYFLANITYRGTYFVMLTYNIVLILSSF